MKRGNTALKRGVGLASAFALAIAGAVIAAPAANAAPAAADAVRPAPLADSIWVGPDGAVLSAPATAAPYSSTASPAAGDRATGTANLLNVGGTYQAAGGLQIALLASGGGNTPGWTTSQTVTVALTGGGNSAGVNNVTFSKVPNTVTLAQNPVAITELATRAGFNGTHATAATPIGAAPTTVWGTITPTVSADGKTLTVTLPDPANAVPGTAATDVYLLSLTGIQLNVASDADVSAPVVVATVAGTGGASGFTTLGYLSPYVFTTSGDATFTNNSVALPALVLSEATKEAFNDGSVTDFTVQVSGTDLDATHPIGFAAAGAGTLSGATSTAGETVTNGAVAGGATTATFQLSDGDDSKIEKISLSGLKVQNVKPGTDVTLTIVPNSPATVLNNASNTAAAGFAYAPSQVKGASVTVKASDVQARIAGKNRYETAAKIADLRNWTGDAVIIANGTDMKNGADALAANYFAGVKDAPILLTGSDSLAPEAEAELTKLFKDSGAKVTIYVLGKTDSVSSAARTKALDTVKATLNPVGSAEVVEIAGNDRYETSAAVVDKAGAAAIATANLGKGNLRTAFLASGQVNADALAAGAVAAGAHIPVLLTTNGDALPASVAKTIKDQHIDQIIVLGANDRISDKVEADLKADGVNVIRVAGANRYDTSVKLSTLVRKNPTDGLGLNGGSTVYLANGDGGWADALAVGPLAGLAGNAVLTVNSGASLPSVTATYLKDDTSGLANVEGVGGTDRVTDSAIAEAAKALLP